VRLGGLTYFLVVSGVSAASGLPLLGLVLGVRNCPLLLLGFTLAGYGQRPPPSELLWRRLRASQMVNKDWPVDINMSAKSEPPSGWSSSPP
jgi:hypothetical protein